MGTGLRAGVACVELEPPLGAAMMGYGARTGHAEARHDPLTARALWLCDGVGEALLVACDLCLVAPQQAAGVRERIQARTGVPVPHVLLSCIHTHSGPDTGFGALLSGHEPDAYVAGLESTMVEAAARAHAAAAPARLGWGHTETRIGCNRRDAHAPIDPEVLVLRVDRRDGAPLAVVFVHGCHPTALGHENLAYSADWPWAARREVERGLPGATALFLLGAHADVDPRTRGLLDLGVPNQSLGVPFEQVESLGVEVGHAVGEAATALETRSDARIGAAVTRVAIPVHGADTDGAAYAERLASERSAALEALGLPADAAARTFELFRLEGERTAHLPLAQRRAAIARVRLYLRDRTAPRFAFGRRPEVEVQALGLGEARLLALPLEPTVAVGLDWKRRQGERPAAVLGIGNGWMRYLPHPDDFREPDAHLKYEILQSTLVPEAAPRLLGAGAGLAAELRT